MEQYLLPTGHMSEFVFDTAEENNYQSDFEASSEFEIEIH